MTKFIELTDTAGKTVLYNTAVIKYIEIYKDKVAVRFINDTEIFVSETYEAIKKLILE